VRPGIKLLADEPGTGLLVQRQRVYLIRLKIWLNRGEPVRWNQAAGRVDRARLQDEGATQISDLRIDREQLIPGLFQAVQGMRVGGTRRLRIAPHLAYGERGVPGIIPPNALLEAEISILEPRNGASCDADRPG
jgi:hypothetical protein